LRPASRRRREYIVLALITLLGAALRIYRLDTDLWIDEIGSFQYAMSVTVGELVRTFSSPNQHLLNSLLERVSVATFGEHDWSIRLPAVLFGIATVPAIYWLARTVMGGWQSLSVAFLTAVSYHHIWFSQNARGYSGYLLFCVIATTAFWHLIHSDESRWIWIYVASAVLSLASLIIAAPVIATHVMLAAFYLVRASRRGDTITPIVRRLLIAFGVTGLASLVLYGPTAVQILRSVGSAYVTQGTGFDPKSLDFLEETLRGLGAGFGSLALVGAIPFLGLVAFGSLSLMRRGWIIVLSFVLPLGMLATLVIVAGWLTSPRFFVLVVPLAFLVAVESLDIVAKMFARFAPNASRSRVRGGLAGAAVLVCAVALAFGLPRYYAIPKQSFRAALSTFNTRSQPEDALIAVYQADRGFQMYTQRLGLDTTARYFSTRTVSGFDSLGTRLAGRRVWVATTMERAFQLEEPALWKRVEDGWTRVETLPATVGNGEITIWQPKASR
jgi:hypothetical protein